MARLPSARGEETKKNRKWHFLPKIGKIPKIRMKVGGSVFGDDLYAECEVPEVPSTSPPKEDLTTTLAPAPQESQSRKRPLIDNEKRTPLHAAAYLGDTEILELLILSGARVNAKDNKCLNTLHRAVASCSEEAVQVLLKHSADVNARDKNWQTPLHIAAANKAVCCAKALNVSDQAGHTALHHAVFRGHLEEVRHMKDIQVDVTPNLQ
ncbi:serine/threonine-protein phosphatase 6 regulatory ankyrin repeat subunit A-like [Salvelinus namaycush]|uniref:Serine/threonine-protein phosphatase 6 regulatory ankyrin repeat subunit A-like n=1 Tax=Salvelinus namaycush TaxID=8040 RepID=A0A8U0UED8_SALNM|nr:serine/threonine-protein phosphatase 6 regulatory ankyrin repeat subunit A-like [Salvelinus namaycush]